VKDNNVSDPGKNQADWQEP